MTQHERSPTRTDALVVPSVSAQAEMLNPGVPQTHDVAWHTLDSEQAVAHLGTSLDGLALEAVAARREVYGENRLPAHQPPTLWMVFLHQFMSPLIYILLIAGVVSLLIQDYKDAIFIFVVVLLNAAIGTFQEYKAEQSAAALQSLLRIFARVRREGREEQVGAEELVPGDIVLLESGNRVPADLRLLAARKLAIDESFLTGESQAVEKHVNGLEKETGVSDRRNMAFAGATVTTGRGVGVVTATGSLTEVGKIAKTVAESTAAKPPLVIRMERFAKKVSLLVVGASLLIGLIALLEGFPLAEVFFLAVALAVSAIPEGLPVAMTVALSVATVRMARRSVIVRRLAAVESLGSCTCIASDKTGTLTVNRQTLKVIVTPDGGRFQVTGEGYSGSGEILDAQGRRLDEAIHPDGMEDDPEARATCIRELTRAAVLCTEASLENRDGEWRYSGDAVDVAVLALSYKLGLDPRSVRAAVARLEDIPFEPERRFAAHIYAANGTKRVAVKGAVEVVLDAATQMRTADGVAPVARAALEEQAVALAADGYRVLAVAEGDLNGMDTAVVAEGALPPLTILGLVGFIDPLRSEVKDAVDRARAAGVEVVMITGDHPATALAIARELGIADSWDDVVTGPQLAELGLPESPAFGEKVVAVKVFARVTPIQKLEIVEVLRAAGHFVAVTGDGVNDAPALRRANIGVAMGSGTDVAKDTASMIVIDDNFASIVAGIEEGRYAYDNVRKVTYLLISTGAAEVLLITLSLLFFLPIPLLAVQILWLNLVTNGIQDVALAFEGGEPGAMDRPPRKPAEGILNGLMVQQMIISGATMAAVAFGLWYWFMQAGWEEGPARNMVLLLMVLLQNFHVFNCRSEYVSAFRVPIRRNVVLIGGVLAAQGIHILAMQLPFMQGVLQVQPVAVQDWFNLLGLAAIILVVMEGFKLVKFRGAATRRAATAS